MDGDGIEFPDSWLAVLRPRRSGRRGWPYRVTDDDVASVAGARQAHASAISAILDNPLSDPELVELARCDLTTAEAVGVRMAIDSKLLSQLPPVFRAEECVRLLGLPAAVAACVASAGARVVFGHQLDPSGEEFALVRTVTSAGLGIVVDSLWRVDYDLLKHLRRLLSFADEATWQAAVDQLEPLRGGPWAQRLATSFLIPDRRDWVLADIADLPEDCPWWVRNSFLASSAFTAAQLANVRTAELAEIVTMIDAIGSQATPILLRCLDWAAHDAHWRKRLLDVLVQLGSYDVVHGLLSRAGTAGVPAAFEAVARGNPELALETLLRHAGEPFVPALLARHRRAFPDLDGMPADERPQAATPDTLPAILTSPPWTRPRAKPVSVAAPDIGVEIRWLDGERDEWNADRWPSFEETHYDSFYAEHPNWSRFYLGGSEAAVRPRLATWEAEKASFHLDNPKLLVAKYELDAYPPVLRLARSKPALGAELLLPYLSSDVTMLMGRWLAGSRQFRPLAQQWFRRHGPTAVTALMPIALGRPSAEGRAAALALSRLDPDLVREAGRQLGCLPHVDALLARDPLDAVPSKVPEIPSWLDLGMLPPIITGDGYALGTAETEVLCRMIAMSQLDDPYPGLAAVAGAFNAASLDAFSWALFSGWHLAGRPSKDLWAMDAIGYFGGAVAVERLASLVRRWPSESAAQRAKRGVDALGVNESNAALRELSSIARNAKSIPLRQHAARVLDRAAADRGLLPEQLDDLLAPDLGLDGDRIGYQGVAYTPDVGAKLDLVLRAPDGRTVATLPKPADEEEKATQSEWNKRRRKAGADIADQVRRLEEALIVQRRWSVSDFTTAVAAHPVLRRLAQRLVWSTGGKLAIVDDLGDLVDEGGGLLDVGDWVQLAHPATADLEPWRARLHERGLGQPFEQLDRTVHDGDPSRHWGDVVSAASLFTLVRRGWHWGASGRAATRGQVFRPFGAEGSVVVHFSPGLSAVQNPATEPDQRIEEISLQSPTHGELAVFGDLPRVTRSELLRDLARLERR